MKWAVLGASGFVGSRFVEKMHLTGSASVRPVVRNFSSLARLARFDLDWRVTDLQDVPALTEAFTGCDFILHSIVGDESTILGSIERVYQAACQAGVRRIVYLSSSSVHGLAPDPATTEDTPLSDQQAFTYNNAKVRAEKLWAQTRAGGKVEVVGLRPSIVFGPRSRWCADIAREALAGTAYLVREGSGICNTIYVDNLLHAIERAAEAPQVDGHFFLVRDRERVTWKEFYAPILDACGVPLSAVHHAEPPPAPQPSLKDRLSKFRASPLVQKIKPLAPRVAVRMGKAALEALPSPAAQSSPWPGEGKPQPHVTAEIATLQLCEWEMSCAKADKMLGYAPTVTFADGMQRSIGWVKFAGYPIRAIA
jgi:nucleoside-diphosphate-sugar epimerase